jgi:hypothetical protein
MIITQPYISKVCPVFENLPISEGMNGISYQSSKYFLHRERIIVTFERVSRTSPGARSLVDLVAPRMPDGRHKPMKSACAVKQPRCAPVKDGSLAAAAITGAHAPSELVRTASDGAVGRYRMASISGERRRRGLSPSHRIGTGVIRQWMTNRSRSALDVESGVGGNET